MNPTRHLRVPVTDCNHRPRGMMWIAVVFDDAGPLRVEHNGLTYWFSGSAGTRRDTGVAIRRLCGPNEARLWITLQGTEVWED